MGCKMGKTLRKHIYFKEAERSFCSVLFFEMPSEKEGQGSSTAVGVSGWSPNSETHRKPTVSAWPKVEEMRV